MSFHFLYREDKGKIDRATWWRAIAYVAAGWVAVFALYWIVANVYTLEGDALVVHSSDGAAETMKAFDKPHGILIGPAALLLIGSIFAAVCFYFVSAKRFQDRLLNGSMALALPLMILFTAAIHWMQPRIGATFPGWLTVVFDLALAGLAVWNIWELGFKESA